MRLNKQLYLLANVLTIVTVWTQNIAICDVLKIFNKTWTLANGGADLTNTASSIISN